MIEIKNSHTQIVSFSETVIHKNKNEIKNIKNKTFTNSKYTKRCFFYCEIFISVLFFLILFWQVIIAISIKQDVDENVEQNYSYNYLIKYLVSPVIIYDMKIVNISEKCPDNFYPYILKYVSSIKNVCVDSDKNNIMKVIKYGPDCVNILNFEKQIKLSHINDAKFCYQTFPLNYHIYMFSPLDTDCDDLEYLTCGKTNIYNICLKKNDKIQKCPVSILKFYDENDSPNESYFSLLQKFPKLKKNLYYSNYITDKYPYMSIDMSWDFFNEMDFYEFRKLNNELLNNDLQETTDNMIFKYYNTKLSKINDIVIDLGSSNNITPSQYIYSEFSIKAIEFFKEYNITDNNKTIHLYDTLDVNKNVSLKTTYIPIPSDSCISHFFDGPNSDKTLFSLLAGFSFDTFTRNYYIFITWNFIQISLLFIYSFLYRIHIISDNINNIVTEIDRKSNLINAITLKLFYNFSMGMKFWIMYNLFIFSKIEGNLIYDLIDKKCYADYSNNSTNNSYVHLNLMNYFYSNSYLNMISSKSILIICLTIPEIVMEVIFFTYVIIKLCN